MMKAIDFSKSYTKDWAKQSANLFVADLVGTSLEAAAVAKMESFEQAVPGLSNWAINTVAPTVSYFQPQIEKALGATTNFEGAELQKQRLNKPKEERARDLAHAVIHYGVPVGVGWATTIGTERVLCKINHAPHLEKKFWFADMSIHLGLIALMGTPTLAPVTEKAKGVVNAITKVFGATDEQAEDVSRLAVLSAVPNYATFGIVSTSLYHHHKNLAKQLGIASELTPKL